MLPSRPYPPESMLHLQKIIPVLIAATTHAAEVTLEVKPFFIAHSFPATVLPEQSIPIRIDAEKWTDFQILTIADHGSSVKKDQPLITFDTEEIDKSLTDTRRAISSETLSLAQAELDLATLRKTVPEQLTRLKADALEADEELSYFTETRRKSQEESAGFDLKRSEQILASYQEELKQLLAMYEADDLTEDTEEIILQKQQDSVETAEFALRMEVLNHKRTVEISIPRQAVKLTQARDDSALKLDKATKDLPRSIELKELEIEDLKTSLERNQSALAEMTKDRSLFEIKAPADGLFYYGTIDDGKWTIGETAKTLVIEGKPPTRIHIATFIPADSKLSLHAFLDQATAQALAAQTTGSANLPGRADVTIPVSLKNISTIPNPDLTHTATLAPEWPENAAPSPGESVQVHLVSYTSEKAITVPSKALKYGPTGWTVEVKLADGKTEHRPVTRGRSSAEETEITSGLEAGLVIITP